MQGVLIALFVLGGVAFLIACVLALIFGRWSRFPVLAAAGVLAIPCLIVVQVLRTDPETCHDCTEWRGGAYHPLDVMMGFANVAGWIGGAVVGTAVRERRRRPRSHG